MTDAIIDLVRAQQRAAVASYVAAFEAAHWQARDGGTTPKPEYRGKVFDEWGREIVGSWRSMTTGHGDSSLVFMPRDR